MLQRIPQILNTNKSRKCLEKHGKQSIYYFVCFSLFLTLLNKGAFGDLVCWCLLGFFGFFFWRGGGNTLYLI